MLKMIYCVRRREDIPLDEFFRYWEKNHAPLVIQHSAAMRIVRYIQNPTMPTPFNEVIRAGRGLQEPFDGVAELWWKGMDDLQQAAASPDFIEAQNALIEDEKRFIDLEHSCCYFCEERTVIDNN